MNETIDELKRSLAILQEHGITLQSHETLLREIEKWRGLAIAAADEAAGWYDECRGGDRSDLPAVRAVDRARCAARP